MDQRLNIVKMITLPELTYQFDVIFIQIPAGFFTDKTSRGLWSGEQREEARG